MAQYKDKLTVTQLRKLISQYNLRNAVKGYSSMKRERLLSKIREIGYEPNNDPKNPQLRPLAPVLRRKIIIR